MQCNVNLPKKLATSPQSENFWELAHGLTPLIGESQAAHNFTFCHFFYELNITGGVLTHEVGGSTVQATWFPLAEVPELDRAVVVDMGISLAAERPAHGQPEPVKATGKIRN